MIVHHNNLFFGFCLIDFPEAQEEATSLNERKSSKKTFSFPSFQNYRNKNLGSTSMGIFFRSIKKRPSEYSEPDITHYLKNAFFNKLKDTNTLPKYETKVISDASRFQCILIFNLCWAEERKEEYKNKKISQDDDKKLSRSSNDELIPSQSDLNSKLNEAFLLGPSEAYLPSIKESKFFSVEKIISATFLNKSSLFIEKFNADDKQSNFTKSYDRLSNMNASADKVAVQSNKNNHNLSPRDDVKPNNIQSETVLKPLSMETLSGLDNRSVDFSARPLLKTEVFTPYFTENFIEPSKGELKQFMSEKKKSDDTLILKNSSLRELECSNTEIQCDNIFNSAKEIKKKELEVLPSSPKPKKTHINVARFDSNERVNKLVDIYAEAYISYLIKIYFRSITRVYSLEFYGSSFKLSHYHTLYRKADSKKQHFVGKTSWKSRRNARSLHYSLSSCVLFSYIFCKNKILNTSFSDKLAKPFHFINTIYSPSTIESYTFSKNLCIENFEIADTFGSINIHNPLCVNNEVENSHVSDIYISQINKNKMVNRLSKKTSQLTKIPRSSSKSVSFKPNKKPLFKKILEPQKFSHSLSKTLTLETKDGKLMIPKDFASPPHKITTHGLNSLIKSKTIQELTSSDEQLPKNFEDKKSGKKESVIQSFLLHKICRCKESHPLSYFQQDGMSQKRKKNLNQFKTTQNLSGNLNIVCSLRKEEPKNFSEKINPAARKSDNRNATKGKPNDKCLHFHEISKMGVSKDDFHIPFQFVVSSPSASTNFISKNSHHTFLESFNNSLTPHSSRPSIQGSRWDEEVRQIRNLLTEYQKHTKNDTIHI